MIEAGHQGRMIGAEMNRMKKLAVLEASKKSAAAQIPKLTSDELFYLGLGIYWGEGVKAASSALAVVNSDVRILKIMVEWFKLHFAVTPDDFHPTIFISSTHRRREAKLLTYWSRELKIPKRQFAKTIFLERRKKVYENHDSYYGVLALRVRRGTDTRYKILALLDRVSEMPLPG